MNEVVDESVVKVVVAVEVVGEKVVIVVLVHRQWKYPFVRAPWLLNYPTPCSCSKQLFGRYRMQSSDGRCAL